MTVGFVSKQIECPAQNPLRRLIAACRYRQQDGSEQQSDPSGILPASAQLSLDYPDKGGTDGLQAA